MAMQSLTANRTELIIFKKVKNNVKLIYVIVLLGPAARIQIKLICS